MLASLPSSPSQSTWLSQLEMLRAALSHDPTNPLAWRWRVRIKVLSFLVSRYGDTSNPSFDSGLSKTFQSASPAVVFLPYDARPVHSRVAIRKLLEEIAAINRETPDR